MESGIGSGTSCGRPSLRAPVFGSNRVRGLPAQPRRRNRRREAGRNRFGIGRGERNGAGRRNRRDARGGEDVSKMARHEGRRDGRIRTAGTMADRGIAGGSSRRRGFRFRSRGEGEIHADVTLAREAFGAAVGATVIVERRREERRCGSNLGFRRFDRRRGRKGGALPFGGAGGEGSGRTFALQCGRERPPARRYGETEEPDAGDDLQKIPVHADAIHPALSSRVAGTPVKRSPTRDASRSPDPRRLSRAPPAPPGGPFHFAEDRTFPLRVDAAVHIPCQPRPSLPTFGSSPRPTGATIPSPPARPIPAPETVRP